MMMRYEFPSLRLGRPFTFAQPFALLAAIATVSGLTASGLMVAALPAQANWVPVAEAVPSDTPVDTTVAANAATRPTVSPSAEVDSTAAMTERLADGVYLYGQAPKPDQLGQGYFVFEVNKGQVYGALYMPRSSFDCASGRFSGQQLALTVVNSYDRLANPYAIALEKTSTVATAGNPAPQTIGLEGFHPLPVTASDRRILAVCKADLRK
jgi:hypothetical protein